MPRSRRYLDTPGQGEIVTKADMDQFTLDKLWGRGTLRRLTCHTCTPV